MDDLISKEAALNCFYNWIDQYGNEHTADEMPEYGRIEALPPARPERIRGRWVKDEEASNLHVEPIYICSACNNMDAWGDAEKNTFKFCPNCGADMREGGENATD